MFTEKGKQIKIEAKTKHFNELKKGWKDKRLHGKYPIRASDVNSSQTNHWLGSSALKYETERFIIAAQDQCPQTRSFQANILENGADLKYRVCDKHTETMNYLVSSCHMVAPAKCNDVTNSRLDDKLPLASL